jgi:putative restriction endonuclease
MKSEEVLRSFDSMRVWQKGERRAVHKPLLVLFALGRIAAGKPESLDWNEADPELKRLLMEFGPNGAASSRHNPFWHLRTDGLWSLQGPPALLSRPPKATPTLGELRDHQVRGGFPKAIHEALGNDPALLMTLAQRIVAAHFPESIRSDVLSAAGLPTDLPYAWLDPTGVRRRDSGFRDKVLMAYQYRCAVCGHDLRLGCQTIGLEAAHIKWFQAKGPDIVPNGIALCSLHHKVFDLGAFRVLPGSYHMVFSQQLNGSDEAAGRMLAYHGAGMILPQSSEYLPRAEFLEWHGREVFKDPPRA